MAGRGPGLALPRAKLAVSGSEHPIVPRLHHPTAAIISPTAFIPLPPFTRGTQPFLHSSAGHSLPLACGNARPLPFIHPPPALASCHSAVSLDSTAFARPDILASPLERSLALFTTTCARASVSHSSNPNKKAQLTIKINGSQLPCLVSSPLLGSSSYPSFASLASCVASPWILLRNIRFIGFTTAVPSHLRHL
ncbi:hypothetical protein PaG_04955 [Moesziomyces aphidis]|uniref:Uncharacterized protein n=1 Tax=Moesziomyces aphidis TaxID=84754 RepID=W3VHH1_MOEAP|nr:hypothetical protein PaG_04955 [Moesziomyces aphidis]